MLILHQEKLVRRNMSNKRKQQKLILSKGFGVGVMLIPVIFMCVALSLPFYGFDVIWNDKATLVSYAYLVDNGDSVSQIFAYQLFDIMILYLLVVPFISAGLTTVP